VAQNYHIAFNVMFEWGSTAQKPRSKEFFECAEQRSGFVDRLTKGD
jgi:hypothetical protein